ncbi:beta-hexosaminidase [Robertkochia solimangrovi]|nr:beta-hexosaminidase [Robertkochia solimangrovi]
MEAYASPLEARFLVPNGNKDSLSVHLDTSNSALKAQEYVLDIKHNSIFLISGDDAGLYYGVQTLRQVLSYYKDTETAVPSMKIQDHPDFERRGFMLDISRDKVPTMTSLYKLVDLLAMLKINELQLYTEHTFAFRNHRTVWEDASPMTPAQIRELDAYCKKRFIDLVPNQNSFGHMENWLKHDEYLPLAECPDDCNTIWGMRKRTSLDPTNPNSLKLMEELYAELLPNFSSEYFNIGCDETVELGLGRSKEICDEQGKGNVYLDYVIKLNEAANRNGKKAQFWGDIILNHPELIARIPENMTALVWGYSADYPFEKNLPKFKEAGIPFYVCPGTSSWRSLIGQNENAFTNLKRAAQEGLANKAKGYLNTNWGDYGYWQPFSITYAPLMAGAAYSWNANSDPVKNLEFQLNRYVFEDETQNTARAILKLGNAYTLTGIPAGNANLFHLMLHRYKWTINGNYQTKQINKNGLNAAEKEINDALGILESGAMRSKDSAQVMAEIKLAAALSLHAIHLGEARMNAPEMATKNIPQDIKQQLHDELEPLIEKYKELYVIRNRKGGLEDSVSKLQEVLDAYK